MYYFIISGRPAEHTLLPKESFDLAIADPPFGINENSFDQKHYNRKEENVASGYREAPSDYYRFSYEFLSEIYRILKPTGSAYIVSSWSNSHHIHRAINESRFFLKNKIIWKYNFGVYTKRKYVSSHYEIFFITKHKTKYIFNTYSRYKGTKDSYADRESVWIVNREYKKNQVKYKNQLPEKLIQKMIEYSSKEGDMIADIFSGSLTTTKVATRMHRLSIAADLNPANFLFMVPEISEEEKAKSREAEMNMRRQYPEVKS